MCSPLGYMGGGGQRHGEGDGQVGLHYMQDIKQTEGKRAAKELTPNKKRK